MLAGGGRKLAEAPKGKRMGRLAEIDKMLACRAGSYWQQLEEAGEACWGRERLAEAGKGLRGLCGASGNAFPWSIYFDIIISITQTSSKHHQKNLNHQRITKTISPKHHPKHHPNIAQISPKHCFCCDSVTPGCFLGALFRDCCV